MIIQSPHCGGSVPVNGFGRRPLNIDVTKVCGTLQKHHSEVVVCRAKLSEREVVVKRPKNLF